MSRFPTLKTGALAQYPVERESQFRTFVARFVDGSEQRFRQKRRSTRRWVLDLRLLMESECAAIRAFFEEVGGSAGEFYFTDPFDGIEYPRCRFEVDSLEMSWEFDGRGDCRVVIAEEES